MKRFLEKQVGRRLRPSQPQRRNRPGAPRFIALVLAVVALGLAAGGVASGVFRAAGTPSAMPDVRAPGGRAQAVGRFQADGGAAERHVVLQRTADGFLCVWDSPDASAEHGVGGCNSAADPLAGRKLFASLAYEGGPAPATVRDARLSGIVAADVASAELVWSDGSTHAIPLVTASTRAVAGKDYRVFAYRIRQADLRRGATPVEIVVRAADGEVIDRQTTGIG
jgi:hypothetical protein